MDSIIERKGLESQGACLIDGSAAEYDGVNNGEERGFCGNSIARRADAGKQILVTKEEP